MNSAHCRTCDAANGSPTRQSLYATTPCAVKYSLTDLLTIDDIPSHELACDGVAIGGVCQRRAAWTAQTAGTAGTNALQRHLGLIDGVWTEGCSRPGLLSTINNDGLLGGTDGMLTCGRAGDI